MLLVVDLVMLACIILLTIGRFYYWHKEQKTFEEYVAQCRKEREDV